VRLRKRRYGSAGRRKVYIRDVGGESKMVSRSERIEGPREGIARGRWGAVSREDEDDDERWRRGGRLL
jgi:hypothetical protein